MTQALNNYFEALTPNDSITLNANRLGDVADDVILINHKNNVAKEELEKARVYLIRKLSENYSILNQANSSVTNLLQFAVTNKEARSETYEKLSRATAGDINLNKVFAELDDFVEKNGAKSGKAINLVEKLESTLDKETTNERSRVVGTQGTKRAELRLKNIPQKHPASSDSPRRKLLQSSRQQKLIRKNCLN